MKRLILLRHAKSGWVNPELNDLDRPLNKRGKRGAKALGKWLRGTEYRPDQILCSTARRTRETWEGLGLEGEPELLDALYHAGPDAMLEALKAAKGATVMMIGHNPGIAMFAHELVETPPEHSRFGDFPTGATLVAGFDIKKWSKLEPRKGKVLEFLTPHDLIDQSE
ncbi:SixA phosphatase family protein [Aliiruegeria lutimaris]|uniref:Phosphohistidine phosphatase n=1 Tax=Aliiruegeria lutimaris TaxID=571298 RepID=A0A1G9H848_9RHOB|nr:histidine phosphatase family protein [Aliiruegeria lutimaris]SDL09069.1 phosphohistidine phosphatase [Aliiruegeria lutimaris]